MRFVLLLTFLMFVAMGCTGCETEPFQFGFKNPSAHFAMSMTGISFSWPVVCGGLVLFGLLAALRRRRDRKDS